MAKPAKVLVPGWQLWVSPATVPIDITHTHARYKVTVTVARRPAVKVNSWTIGTVGNTATASHSKRMPDISAHADQCLRQVQTA